MSLTPPAHTQDRNGLQLLDTLEAFRVQEKLFNFWFNLCVAIPSSLSEKDFSLIPNFHPSSLFLFDASGCPAFCVAFFREASRPP